MGALSYGDVALLRPLWLGVALVLAALAVAARAHRPSAHDGWRRVMSPAVLAWLGGDGTHGRRRGSLALTLAVAALVAVALAGPATRRHDAESFRHSSGWIALADVSRSMTLDDALPTRLGAARETLLALSARAGARPLALILYAGDAFLVVPSTFERRLFDEQVALLEHGVVPLEGSNLARALSLAAAVAVDSDLVRARVLVLGDSGGIGETSEAAARYLVESGHRVDVVLFGGEAGDADSARAGGREDDAGGGARTGTGESDDASSTDDAGGTTAIGAPETSGAQAENAAADTGDGDAPAAEGTSAAEGADGADGTGETNEASGTATEPTNGDDTARRNPRAALEGADVTSLTASTTAGALAVDVAAGERLARAGGGELVRADALGRVRLDALGLDRERGPADVAALEAVLWQDRSHWLLLALLPLVLALFGRRRLDAG